MKTEGGAILVAGGLGARMGGDKALMPLAGRPLAQWACEALREVFGERIAVAAKDAEKFSFLGVPVALDVLDIRSPLAGIHAGLLALDAPWALTAGCDTPLLQPEFLRFMVSRYRGEEALVPFAGGRLQTLHAVYAKCAAPRMEAYAASGRRSVHGFLEEVSARVLREDAVAELAAFAPSFFNVNTPEDFAEAEKKIKGLGLRV